MFRWLSRIRIPRRNSVGKRISSPVYSTPPKELRGLLSEHLEMIARAVLRFGPDRRIDHRQPLQELGSIR